MVYKRFEDMTYEELEKLANSERGSEKMRDFAMKLLTMKFGRDYDEKYDGSFGRVEQAHAKENAHGLQ